MFLLLSNDDGYLSPGLTLMADVLRKEVERLAIMAPDRNCSAASHCLTLSRPLSVYAHGQEVYSVDGTPADCVYLATSGYFDCIPDMVISGINRGANLGNDVIYSGTVAAAFEGRYLSMPAIAVSNISENPKYFADSALIIRDILRHILKYPLSKKIFLNINIPDLPYKDIKGFKITTLGHRGPALPAIEVQNPRGQKMFWVGRFSAAEKQHSSTDMAVVTDGYVSITPLQFNLTHYQQLEPIEHWLKGISHD
ncbi:5'/3'-nucleotidase SurE [Suttonella ornithocola]|uniref:5'-nucleotidase SurE n=1 Tax=Suttonella ornithocola TaxID=279832 RepID=A0A380RB44_9GAMM|nr:5'/3'-nucleotidase SurE [Suttonella ornithocola]SUO95428.1 5'-nucleotidase surE [Suttonella ornithocola]SUQ09736.1 5'-nucleotidase surE [Suttonella ornithocola]